MTELNHRRATRGSRGRGRWWWQLPAGHCRYWQRLHHHELRALVRQLMARGDFDGIPARVERTIRWDYW